jgi:hypothetical protein
MTYNKIRHAGLGRPSCYSDNFNAFTVTDTAAVAATPLPAALPLFASGLGALGLLGWRKKRRAAAQLHDQGKAISRAASAAFLNWSVPPAGPAVIRPNKSKQLDYNFRYRLVSSPTCYWHCLAI